MKAELKHAEENPKDVTVISMKSSPRALWIFAMLSFGFQSPT